MWCCVVLCDVLWFCVWGLVVLCGVLWFCVVCDGCGV